MTAVPAIPTCPFAPSADIRPKAALVRARPSFREIGSQPISENIAVGSRFDVASKAIFQLRSVEGRLLELLLRLRERLHFEHNESMTGHVRGHYRREVAFERFERAELEHALEAHGMRDCRIIVAADIRQHCIGGRAIYPV